MSARCQRLDAAGTAPLTREIIGLYRLCYAAPPWSETPEQLDAYPDRLTHALAQPGFVAHLSWDNDRRLVGVCYGWPTPDGLPDAPVYRMLRQAFGAAAARELIQGAFEMAELFVHPDTRAQGLGRVLLTGTVAGWHAAWLITSPEAPAARLYRSLGWRQVGELPIAPSSQPPLAVFRFDSPHGDR